MTRERRRQLARLARQMNRQGGRWLPVTRDLLDCLEIAIRSDEADFLLKTSGRALKRESLATLSNLPIEAFDTFFADLQKKGLLLLHSEQHGDEHYSLAPFFVGWLECYMTGGDSPERTEFARRMRIYFDYFRKFNITPLRELHNSQARWTRPLQAVLPLEPPPVSSARGTRIVVGKSLEIPASEVHPPASVLEIIERHGAPGAIGLIRCFCREMSRRADEPCQYNLPSEACIVLGPMVEHAVRFGIGRHITRDAALEKIRETAKLGAIHTVFHQANLGGLQEVAICNCCRDCCVVLGSNARGLVPLRYKAFWLARVADADTCSHCGECERRCPVQAICARPNGPSVDDKRCLGCGQCTSNCPTSTLELVPNEHFVLIPLRRPSEAG